MVVVRFKVPAAAVRREFAVYVMVAKPKRGGKPKLYVGKTGDNREGCNPVISRAGNHFSFNVLHSQVRNKLGSPETYDFEFFCTSFGAYVEPLAERRQRVNIINEMERQLNTLAQKAFPTMVINPYKGGSRIAAKDGRWLATPARMKKLERLVDEVRRALKA